MKGGDLCAKVPGNLRGHSFLRDSLVANSLTE
jgi:hypothetical protein